MKESKRGKINKGTDKRLNIVINIILSFTKKNQILSNTFRLFILRLIEVMNFLMISQIYSLFNPSFIKFYYLDVGSISEFSDS